MKDAFEVLEVEVESVVTDKAVTLEVDEAAVLKLLEVVVFCGPTMELSAPETIR